MPVLQGCDVGIEVDGKRLEEYGTQINAATATAWIESEAGKVRLIRVLIKRGRDSRTLAYLYFSKEFSVTFKADKTTYHHSGLDIIVHLDGCSTYYFPCLEETVGEKLHISTIQIAEGLRRHFMFSNVTLTGVFNSLVVYVALLNSLLKTTRKWHHHRKTSKIWDA